MCFHIAEAFIAEIMLDHRWEGHGSGVTRNRQPPALADCGDGERVPVRHRDTFGRSQVTLIQPGDDQVNDIHRHPAIDRAVAAPAVTSRSPRRNRSAWMLVLNAVTVSFVAAVTITVPFPVSGAPNHASTP